MNTINDQSDWIILNKCLMPKLAHYYNISTDIKQIKKIMNNKGAWLCRWTSDFDMNQEREAWYLVKDIYTPLEKHSKNTRSKIRRSLKRCDTRLITKNELIDSGYDIYRAAFSNYRNIIMKGASKSQFINQIQKKGDDWEFWGVFDSVTNQMIAFSENQLIEDSLFYHTIKAHPGWFKKYYPFYGLIYTMNTYYLKSNNFRYVSDGFRSMTEHSNIQPFLIEKFYFRKAYCNLHLHYNKSLGIIINILYPFRCFFSKSIIHSLLLQEEINRKEIKQKTIKES